MSDDDDYDPMDSGVEWSRPVMDRDTADLIFRLARALAVHHAITLGRDFPDDFEGERGYPHPLVERAHQWLELHAPELLQAEGGVK